MHVSQTGMQGFSISFVVWRDEDSNHGQYEIFISLAASYSLLDHCITNEEGRENVAFVLCEGRDDCHFALK